MNYLNKLFSRLSFRIFLVFWVYSTLIVSFAIFIPYLDQRRVHFVSKNEEHRVKERIVRLMHSPHGRSGMMMPRKLIIIPVNDITQMTNAIDQIDHAPFQHFIYTTIDQSHPRKQNSGKQQISGPYFLDRLDLAFFLIDNKPPQAYYLTRLFDSPISLIGLMMIFSLPFIIISTLSLYKPIKRLQMASERVAKGDWTIDTKLEEGSIEFSMLGKSFNKMVAALTSAEEQKNRLFANLSHELRTPLTRIRLSNSLIRRKTNVCENEVSRIESNLVSLEERVQSMLSLSRQEILSRNHINAISLESALLQLLAEAQFEAEANHKELTYPTLPELTIELNTELFQSGLENILRNAIHYAYKHIEITIEVIQEKLHITILDDGPGVRPEDLSRLFEAFFRGEKQEDIPDSNGAGLGLAIAELMVRTHQGTISAENHPPHGLSVSITIPLVQCTKS